MVIMFEYTDANSDSRNDKTTNDDSALVWDNWPASKVK